MGADKTVPTFFMNTEYIKAYVARRKIIAKTEFTDTEFDVFMAAKHFGLKGLPFAPSEIIKAIGHIGETNAYTVIRKLEKEGYLKKLSHHTFNGNEGRKSSVYVLSTKGNKYIKEILDEQEEV